jgi:S-(hydroxymethyl)glutathione dehydrogenase/alcohol dehydrogenase
VKSAVLTSLNQPLSWEDVELTPLKAGQVKVKILTSGLCGAQLMEIAGLKGNAKFLPHLMGHEGCGIVEGIGEGVSLQIGQKVVMHWMVGSGIDSAFPEYIFRGKKISSGKVTTIGEYSICSENRLTPVGYAVPNELCSLLGCGMTTALGAINNEAEVKIGENALVLGCGGLGLNLIQGLNLVGANDIVVADIKDKEKLAIFNGATRFINLKEKNFLLENKFDVIFDTTGHAELIEDSLKLLADNGRFVMVGQPKSPFAVDSSLFGAKGKRIIATQGGKTNPTVDIPRYASMFVSGKLKFKNIVTNVFPMREINSAVNMLKDGNCGRIILHND